MVSALKCVQMVTQEVSGSSYNVNFWILDDNDVFFHRLLSGKSHDMFGYIRLKKKKR